MKYLSIKDEIKTQMGFWDLQQLDNIYELLQSRLKLGFDQPLVAKKPQPMNNCNQYYISACGFLATRWCMIK